MSLDFHIKFNQKVIVHRIGNGKKLIYALHGYGQLTQFFIRKFKPLVELGYTVIAPEGLHRFYLEGNSGRVGASWMTKEKREQDIENYITYLNAIHAQVFSRKQFRRNYGTRFSQGVATAFRWVADGKVKPKQLTICSGMIPPDVDLEEDSSIFNSMPMTYITGKQDPYRNEELVKSFQAKMNNMKMNYLEFEGGHEIDIDSVIQSLRVKG